MSTTGRLRSPATERSDILEATAATGHAAAASPMVRPKSGEAMEKAVVEDSTGRDGGGREARDAAESSFDEEQGEVESW